MLVIFCRQQLPCSRFIKPVEFSAGRRSQSVIKRLKCKFTKVPADGVCPEQELPNTKLQPPTDAEGRRDSTGERESKRTIQRRGRGRGSVTEAEGGRRLQRTQQHHHHHHRTTAEWQILGCGGTSSSNYVPYFGAESLPPHRQKERE